MERLEILSIRRGIPQGGSSRNYMRLVDSLFNVVPANSVSFENKGKPFRCAVQLRMYDKYRDDNSREI